MADDYVRQLLGTGEVVLIDTRQHWMAAIRFALKPILLLALAGILLVFNQIFDFDGLLDVLNVLARAVLVVAAIIAVVWLPIDLIRWRSRKYILTNRRVIRLEGVLSKNSVDSSIEKINDIESTQSVFGRALGYADLVFYTASDQANEEYDQLMDGLQFKKAVLDAKEAIRKGSPLEALPDGFVVHGGVNAASQAAAVAGTSAGGSPAAPATESAAAAEQTAAVEPDVTTPATDRQDSEPSG